MGSIQGRGWSWDKELCDFKDKPKAEDQAGEQRVLLLTRCFWKSLFDTTFYKIL